MYLDILVPITLLIYFDEWGGILPENETLAVRHISLPPSSHSAHVSNPQNVGVEEVK